MEKPCPDATPSTLVVVGRYILTPAIFELLHFMSPDASGEIQLTDGMQELLHGESLLASGL